MKVKKMGTGAAVPAAAPAPAKPVSSAGFRDRPFPVPATSGEIAILRQNAVTNARELVTHFPSTFGVDDTMSPTDLIITVLDVARQFADYTSGRDAERAVAALTSKISD